MPSPARALLAALAFAVALLALPGAASATYSQELKRYPYLTDVVGNSATVNWGTTRLSISGVLRYGQVGTESCTAHTVQTSKIAMTVGTTQEFQWKAQISGLQPDTEYCYRVYIGSKTEIDLLGDDPSPHFHSQVPYGSNVPYSFAVFGDWASVHADGTNPDLANLMHQVASSGVRFALTTGDNVYPAGSQLSYGDLVQTGQDTSAIFGPNFWTVAGSSIPLFPSMGNHGFSGATTALNNWPEDVAVATSNGKYVRETYCCLNGTTSADYPSTWYAFDVGNTRFYVLEAAWTSTNAGTSDQYGNDYAYHWTPSSEEYRWLQNDLATHPRALKFAFFHYPPYSDNASETSDPYLQGADGLEGLLSRYGVDIAFAGHAHLYERNHSSGPNGLTSYVTGGGGADLEPIGAHACTPIDAYGIGWSYSANGGLGGGSACGGAGVPGEISQVFHFLKVTVSTNGVTITPTDELGRTFDIQTIPVSSANTDLSLTSSTSPDPLYTGNTLTYTLTAQNNGPSDAQGVVATDDLPAGVTYRSATSSQGSCSQAAGTVTCSLGTLASGASATATVEVRPQNAGTITNKATIVGDDMTDTDSSNDSTSTDTTVNPGADLTVTQSDSPDPVVAGDTLTYSLSVKDNGPLDATNVTAIDNLPSNVNYQSVTPSQGSCSETGGVLTCTLGDLASGAAATIDVKVATQSVGTLTNAVTVTTDQHDGNQDNNSTSETTQVSAVADLSIANADSPDPVDAGQTLTYTLTAQNNGPGDAPSVTITDNLPVGVSYQSTTPSQGSCSEVSGTVTCSIGALASGGSATVSLNVTAQVGGTITNQASIAGSGATDRNSANDSASAQTTVNPVADVSITASDAPDPVLLGQPLTYTLTVQNNGPSGATGVTVTDPLPASVAYSSTAPSQGTCFQSVPGTVSCSIGAMASGATATVQIVVTPQVTGTITDQASVRATEKDSSSLNNSASTSTTVVPAANLAVTQTGAPDPATVGQTVTYTVSVKNLGPSSATNVLLSDSVPQGATYQSTTSSQGSCTKAGNSVTCSLGNLASGKTATVTVKVAPTKQGSINNQASASANEADPDVTNNTSTQTTKVKK